MSGPRNRRGFLRGLTMLPLIGGGVTLIGAPSAGAEPVTERLLAEYANRAAFEHCRARVALHGSMARTWYTFHGPAYERHREMSGATARPPSTRAALVLAAVGCGRREGGR